MKDGDSMFNFFIEEGNRHNNRYLISGADYNHIRNVLRMKTGDEFLVSENNVSNLCRIESFEGECIVAEIIEERFQDTSLPIRIFLFQGLPKSDKLELIIQKAVELGVDEIIPVEMNRCVVKLDEKKKKSIISLLHGNITQPQRLCSDQHCSKKTLRFFKQLIVKITESRVKL